MGKDAQKLLEHNTNQEEKIPNDSLINKLNVSTNNVAKVISLIISKVFQTNRSQYQ